MISEVKLDVKPEEVRLFLCKPNREIIAELKEAFNRHLSLNFGYLHELSFTVPSIILDNNNKFVPNSNFKKVRGDFLIKFQKGKDEDYFIITNPNKKSIGGKEVLEVQAIQLPYELKNKTIRDFEAESIRFYDPAGHDGLLNQTLLKLSNWQVDYVDSSLYNIERSFNESKKSLLEFVFEACEKFGDIVPVWDTVNKRVSFYLEENLGIDEGLSIEKGKYLINLEQDNSFDNVYTQITCLGQDGLSIDEINITGTSSLEDFSYYLYPFERDENKNVIQSSTYMSDSLCHALLDYQELLESKQGEFDNLLSTRKPYLDNLSIKQTELEQLENELETILKALDKAIARSQDLTDLNAERDAKQIQIDAKQAEINQINNNIININSQIDSLRNEISIENNFTPEHIVERSYFVREYVWQDNSYTSSSDLLEEGSRRLSKISQPIVSYKIKAVDFLNALNTPHDWDRLKLANIITIRYPDFDIDIKAKVLQINHDIDNNDLNLVIGNVKDLKSGFLQWKDLVQQSVNASSQIDMSKFKWDKSEANSNEISRILNNKWDATKQAVIAGNSENVTVDQRGVTLTNPDNPNQIVRLLSSAIAMSNDGGNTYKLAIDATGVYAEHLIGRIIAGENLIITSDDGIITIDGKKLTVKDDQDRIRALLGQYATGKYGLELRDKTGLKTILDEDGILQTWQEGRTDNVENGYPLVLNVYIPQKTKSISEAILRFRLLNFRAYSRGAASGGGTTSGSSSRNTTASGGQTTSGASSTTTTASAVAEVQVLGMSDSPTPIYFDFTGYGGAHNHGIPSGTRLAVVNSNGEITGSVGWVESGQHEHGVLDHLHKVRIPSHTHNMQHIHTIDSHTHNMEHTHQLPNHTHPIEYGILTSSRAANVTIKINNVDRTAILGGSFNSDQSNLNIASYLNIGQWNTIELGSTQLGRIDATVFVQALMGV